MRVCTYARTHPRTHPPTHVHSGTRYPSDTRKALTAYAVANLSAAQHCEALRFLNLRLHTPAYAQDENLNGIHIETYVLPRNLRERRAPVALHCEHGCPFQEQFIKLFTERAAAEIKAWPGGYAIMGDVEGSCSVCEVSVPFADTPAETVARLKVEVERLERDAGASDRRNNHRVRWENCLRRPPSGTSAPVYLQFVDEK